MLLVHYARLRVGRRNLARRAGRGCNLRQTEIQNLGASTLGHEDIRGLDVTVDYALALGSQTGWLSDEMRRDQCREIRQLLRGCLHSDQDVLLPKMGVAGAVELFFIVAVTDGIGAEAISKRIRKQSDGSEHIKQAGLTLSTSYRSLEPIKLNASESMEDSLEEVGAKLQKLMDEEISSRMVKNG